MLNLGTKVDGEESTFMEGSSVKESSFSDSFASLLQQFTEIWRLEHEAPELLHYEDRLVKSIFSLIAEQKQNIQDIPPGPDSSFLSNLLAFEVRRYINTHHS